MQHKFPFAVLHFIIHSEEIDVNVHPTKMEVRFTNQMQLYDFIETHVRETLHAIELIPETTLGGSRETKKKFDKAAVDKINLKIAVGPVNFRLA